MELLLHACVHKGAKSKYYALIYAMGAEAEQIFKSFTFDNDTHTKRTDYEQVLKKIDVYFVPKRNVI